MQKAIMFDDRDLAILQAIDEVESVEGARNDFWLFCKFIDERFATEDKPHLQKIAKALQMIAERKISKLIISMPPRYGKSYITTLFISWFIGKNPKRSIMRNAYGDSLARRFSRHVKDILEHPLYALVFPEIKIRQDFADLSDWAIEGNHSTYFCGGVGGAITGRGCNGLSILDDPFKNLQEALSPTISENVWGWYQSVHKSRMEANCPEIQIATRWSKYDVIGRIESQSKVIDFKDAQGGEDCWVRLVIPALDENGKSSCEAIKTTQEYQAIKRVTDTVIWEALYMQNPIEASGALFPKSQLNWFKIDELKKDESGKIKRVAGVGYIDTADLGADFTAFPIGYVMDDKKVYIVDVVFSQAGAEVTEPLCAKKILEHQLNKVVVESNAGGRSFARNVRGIVRDYGGKTTVTWKNTSSNKETRILMKSGMIKENFYFREDYEAGGDYEKFITQLLKYVKFGKNLHDDSADSLTGLAEMLYETPKAQVLSKIEFFK